MNIPATAALLQAIADEDRAGMLEAIRAGANPDATLDGRPPIMIAALLGDEQMIDELLRAGANVEARDTAQGWTTTIYLAANGRSEAQRRILERVLDAGADVNVEAPGKDGVRGATALETAIQLKNVTAATVLHARGAQCTTAAMRELNRLKRGDASRGR